MILALKGFLARLVQQARKVILVRKATRELTPQFLVRKVQKVQSVHKVTRDLLGQTLLFLALRVLTVLKDLLVLMVLLDLRDLQVRIQQSQVLLDRKGIREILVPKGLPVLTRRYPDHKVPLVQKVLLAPLERILLSLAHKGHKDLKVFKGRLELIPRFLVLLGQRVIPEMLVLLVQTVLSQVHKVQLARKGTLEIPVLTPLCQAHKVQ